MIRKLVIIFFIASISFAIPLISHAETSIEIIDNDVEEISISVSSSTIRVTGANGQTLYIYNVAGVRIMSIKIDSQDKHYDLNLSKGCYIVKVGKTVRKISIK